VHQLWSPGGRQVKAGQQTDRALPHELSAEVELLNVVASVDPIQGLQPRGADGADVLPGTRPKLEDRELVAMAVEQLAPVREGGDVGLEVVVDDALDDGPGLVFVHVDRRSDELGVLKGLLDAFRQHAEQLGPPPVDELAVLEEQLENVPGSLDGARRLDALAEVRHRDLEVRGCDSVRRQFALETGDAAVGNALRT